MINSRTFLIENYVAILETLITSSILNYLEMISLITIKKQFKIVDVDYFDLYLLDNYDKSDVITSKKKIIYKDVYFFINVIKNIAKLIKYQTIKIRLHRCFRDIAQK